MSKIMGLATPIPNRIPALYTGKETYPYKPLGLRSWLLIPTYQGWEIISRSVALFSFWASARGRTLQIVSDHPFRNAKSRRPSP